MAVYMELSQGDTLVIGNSRIRLERKSGQRARLMIDSTEDIDRIKFGDVVPAASVTPPPAPSRAATNVTPFLKRPVPAAT
jgi:hypothetical protein